MNRLLQITSVHWRLAFRDSFKYPFTKMTMPPSRALCIVLLQTEKAMDFTSLEALRYHKHLQHLPHTVDCQHVQYGLGCQNFQRLNLGGTPGLHVIAGHAWRTSCMVPWTCLANNLKACSPRRRNRGLLCVSLSDSEGSELTRLVRQRLTL